LVTLSNADAPAAIERLAGAGIHMIIDKPAARTASRRATGVRCRPSLWGPRGGGPHAPLLTGGSDGPRDRLGRPARRLIAAEAIFATSSVQVRDPSNPLFDPIATGGGILSWLGIHDVDTLLWLTDEPVVEVSAMAASLGAPGLAVEDVISIALRFAGGAIGTVHLAYALPARGYRNRLAVRGLDASLEFGLDEELVIVTAGGADGGVLEERIAFDVPAVPGYGASGRAAVRDLIDAIRDGRETAASGEAIVRALEVIDAAYESARTGMRVRLA
jgi:predicted dehydrogenase